MAINELAGFPMVLAVSQDAINGQLAKVYGLSTNGPTMFPCVPWDLKGDNNSWTVTVDQFAAPEVDFNTPVTMGCRLKMKIIKGHFSTFSVDASVDPPKVVTIDKPLDGLSMYVTTPMQKLHHDQWSDEEFEVQALFADLEHMSLVELDLSDPTIKIAISGTIKAALETVLADRIKAIGKANPQVLLFGAVKIPKIPKAKQSSGPLAPSASAYSTTVTNTSKGVYETGDLNYLLLLGGDKTLPTGAATGAFTHSLRIEGAAATLVLSEEAVMNTFVIPAIKSAWPGISLNITPDSFVSATPAKATLASDLSFTITSGGDTYPSTLTECTVTISGAVVTINFKMKTTIDHWSGDIHATTTGYETITFSFENGKLTQQKNAPTPTTTTSSNLFTRILGDIITVGFDEIGRMNTTVKGENAIDAIASNMDTAVQSVFSTILLPGEAVFKFESEKLDGQMFVVASYK